MSYSESDHFALQTRNVHKFYGMGKNAFHVLRGLDMDAPYGTIYGLLGASGCGKTTLLRCVLGRLPIQSGQILILGKPPGARGHNVPGKDVGYMPQETALIYEFTMLETMYYFGILFRMNLRYTKKRTEFLQEFLNLPSIHKRCGLMSGGQKRRVSLALALLHEPPLLILDEPTVGIDPLLRAKIWSHLLEISSASNITIILTTHYIEEARQANTVGLMRAGRLLAQSNPEELIRAFNVSTLEAVFLKLSSEQELAEKDRLLRGATNAPTEKTPLLQQAYDEDTDEGSTSVKHPSYFSMPDLAVPKLPRFFNIVALVWKQFLKFIRDPIMLFFIILGPTLNMSVFCLAYGRDLTGLKIYYTNDDTPYNFTDFRNHHNHSYYFGKQFIDNIGDDTIHLKLAKSEGEGIDKVLDGKAFGFFAIPTNFTANYIQWRAEACFQVLHPTISTLGNNTGGIIKLRMDVTNQQIYYTINLTLNDAFERAQQDFYRMLGMPTYLDTPLLSIEEYVYGNEDISFFDTVTTALFAGFIIGLSMTLTATQLITERKEGVIDRTWVAGVTVTEIILSQTFAFFFLELAESIPLFFFTTYVYDLPREGNIALALLLVIIEGMVGMCFGLMVSSLLDNEATALEVAIGIFYPIIFIGGLLWPIESLPKGLRVISKIFPVFYPAHGIQSIMIRGWGITDEPVYMGFIVATAWILIYLFISGLGLHFKK